MRGVVEHSTSSSRLTTSDGKSIGQLSSMARVESSAGLRSTAGYRDLQALNNLNQREHLQQEIFNQAPRPLAPQPGPMEGPYVALAFDQVVFERRANAIPEGAYDQKNLNKLKLVQNMNKMASNYPGGREAMMAHFEQNATEWAAAVKGRSAPKTEQLRKRIMQCWGVMLKDVCPSLPPNAFWDVAVVKRYSVIFLQFLVDHTPPRPGHATIKARTLTEWFALFSHNIVRYCTDPVRNVACGLELLTQGDLFTDLRNQVSSLIHHYKLDRTYDRRVYFGRAEVQILIETALQGKSRQVNIQNIIKLLFPFYMSCRPSSMGPACTEYATLGYYLTLDKIKIFCHGHMRWHIEIDLQNFKGHNDVAAAQQIFILDPVQLTHNALFDIVPYILAYFFLRGVFEIPYETIEELCADNRAQIPLDPAKGKEPLFLALVPGGHAFDEPLRPAMSHSFGNLMGADVAKMVLAHKSGGVFAKHYSRNTANLAVIPLRLGEIQLQGAEGKTNADRHAFASLAVEVLVRRNQALNDKGLSPAELKEMNAKIRNRVVDEMPEMRILLQAYQQAWSSYAACFTESIVLYSRKLVQNIRRVYDIAAGIKRLKKPDHPPLTFLPGLEAEALRCRDDLIDKNTEIRRNRKHLRRMAARQAQKDYNASMRGALSGSHEERNKMVTMSTGVSNVITDLTSKISLQSSTTAIEDWHKTLEIEDATFAMPDFEGEEDRGTEGCDSQGFKFLMNMTGAKPFDEYDDDDSANDHGSLVVLPHASSADNTVGCGNAEEGEKDVPVEDFRRVFLDELVNPVLVERKLKACKTSDGYRCHRCPLYIHWSPVPNPLFNTITGLKRHLASEHSQWRDLELVMASTRTAHFICPGQDFSSNNMQDVADHMVSEDCSSMEHHVGMRTAHAESVYRFRKYNKGPRGGTKASKAILIKGSLHRFDDQESSEADSSADEADEDKAEVQEPVAHETESYARHTALFKHKTLHNSTASEDLAASIAFLDQLSIACPEINKDADFLDIIERLRSARDSGLVIEGYGSSAYLALGYDVVEVGEDEG
ncbi:hypothetical protein Hypma_000479 [Hypsizygus marmoreus]|uniref:Uncharacterized protein n=1 Tax=Hypsizygus marmoreus TaxID=39966 RepID=A0A369JFS7_HYPMA|nr:hypothetical protein Hypma_000479 [Hypsizygus marmoreus]